MNEEDNQWYRNMELSSQRFANKRRKRVRPMVYA
jgi:hypothetical protein